MRTGKNEYLGTLLILKLSFSAVKLKTVAYSKQLLGAGLVAKSCPTLGTPWTVAHQASLSMGFFRQEYWSGLPFPSLATAAKSFQSCPTLCDPIPGILQARTLEWGAIAFSFPSLR